MRYAASIIAPIALWGTAALPQTAPAPPGAAEIVVTGRGPLTPDQAQTFARRISAPIDGQLARLGGEACPRAIGFPPDIAAQIEARIRAVAVQVGVAVGNADCRGNLILFGVDDGAALVRGLHAAQSPLLRGLPDGERGRLMRVAGPARAWSLIELQNEDGVPGLTPAGAWWPTLEVRRASHVGPPTRQSIQLSVVVLEWPALLGRTTVQIADYAAMRMLARTRPDAAPRDVDSILSLFAPGPGAPASLTAADSSYLHTLYRQSTTLHARQQVRDIARNVRKAGR